MTCRACNNTGRVYARGSTVPEPCPDCPEGQRRKAADLSAVLIGQYEAAVGAPGRRRAQLRVMDIDAAAAELSNAVYASTGFLEELEYAGKLRGNGHHARQEVAEAAVKVLRERWEGK